MSSQKLKGKKVIADLVRKWENGLAEQEVLAGALLYSGSYCENYGRPVLTEGPHTSSIHRSLGVSMLPQLPKYMYVGLK